MTFQVDSPGTVLISTLLDILALDISGLDILGLDISGLDILGRFLLKVLHSSSHAMTVLAVEEMRSVVWVLPETAALEVAYHFKLVGPVNSALVSSCYVDYIR